MKDYFASLHILSASELDKLDACVVSKEINKGDFLIQAGSVCQQVVYIKSGMLRSYFVDDQGVQTINCIAFEGELMAAFSSFIKQNPTQENIDAIVDTQVDVIQKEDLDQLYQNSMEWQQLGRVMMERQYIKFEERIVSFLRDDATKRYLLLEKENPKYIKNIPLHYIASYLGISTRHLTRIRKSLL